MNGWPWQVLKFGKIKSIPANVRTLSEASSRRLDTVCDQPKGPNERR